MAKQIVSVGSEPIGNVILDVPIWSDGLDALLERSIDAIDTRAGRATSPYIFACANPHSLAVAERDHEFKRALQGADAVVADGVGLQFAARATGRNLGPRITGSDYFGALMGALDARGGRVGFFGSKPEVLARLVERVNTEFPRVQVATAISPPYGDWSDDTNNQYIAHIAACKLDALWVGMTAPKQEKWVQTNAARLASGVVGSVGAVFDYFAGTVKRAPNWVCAAGLEWAYRFSREPARLWRRNFVSTPQFIGLAVGEALGLRSSR
jgi:N-acetylglucosaminyldiphosphoundecaprenol N-acetyl-beta-D-mannosaminyltransferase